MWLQGEVKKNHFYCVISILHSSKSSSARVVPDSCKLTHSQFSISVYSVIQDHWKIREYLKKKYLYVDYVE